MPGIDRRPSGSGTGGGGSGAVDSVNGQTGVVVLDADDVGAVPSPAYLGAQDPTGLTKSTLAPTAVPTFYDPTSATWDEGGWWATAYFNPSSPGGSTGQYGWDLWLGIGPEGFGNGFTYDKFHLEHDVDGHAVLNETYTETNGGTYYGYIYRYVFAGDTNYVGGHTRLTFATDGIGSVDIRTGIQAPGDPHYQTFVEIKAETSQTERSLDVQSSAGAHTFRVMGDNKMGFFNVTPAAQAAHIADPADLTTLLSTTMPAVLDVLDRFGLTAAS